MSISEYPDNLPLLELFLRLRNEPEFALGIEDYTVLLDAVRLGYGLPDYSALRRLCIMLWVRSNDANRIRIFDYHFDIVLKLPFLEATPDSDPQTGGNNKPHVEVMDEGSKATSGKSEAEAQNTSIQNEVNSKEIARIITQAKHAEENRQDINLDFDTSSIFLHRNPEYFPITQRQMKQAWRFLRRMQRFGPHIELDLRKTIKQIADEGILQDVVLTPRRKNRAQLLLFIDYNGSMFPFNLLSERIAETAKSSGKLGLTGAYYFTNTPLSIVGDHSEDFRVYEEAPNVYPTSIREIIRGYDINNTAVMIVSDAGAMRGRLHQSRVDETRVFLKFLRRLGFDSVVWLNPLPEHRWKNTTAEKICKMLPMVALSRSGFESLVIAMRTQNPLHLDEELEPL